MPYLGREGKFGIRNRFQYLASSGDTSVSGADANSVTMTFSDGIYIDVFLNGVKLKAGEDYNTTTANTVAGITAMSANDEVEVIVYDAFTVADTVSAADGGTFSGNVAMSGTLNVTGAVTAGGILKTDDTTEATSTTDGSLQTDGGLSVAKDAILGDDLKLLSDSSVVSLGADSDVTITHNADKGITLNSMDISGVKSINGTDSGSGANYGQIGGKRNFWYNGDTSICQRAAQVTGLTDGSSGYNVQDRIKFGEGGSPSAVVTQSRVTESPDGFMYSMKWDCTTASGGPDADDVIYFSQTFEGIDLQRWVKGVANARPVTLSFWVNTTKTGIYVCSIYDADNGRQCSQQYTVSSSNTWEYHSVTFPGDTTGAWDIDTALSAYVHFGLSAGTNWTSGTLCSTWEASVTANIFVGQVDALDNTDNNFHLTGIQLELGDTPTAFEYESEQENLLRCMRYFETRLVGIIYSSNNSPSGDYDYAQWVFKARKRATPTVTGHTGTQQQNNVDNASCYNNAAYAQWSASSTADAEL